MRFFYSFLSYILLPVAWLKLAKNRNLSRVSERFGLFKPIKDDVIWVHCVSVGEFLAAKVLIDDLLKSNKILITTTTKTGSDCVIKHYQNQVHHLYFPFDCPIIVKKTISKIKPKIVLLMETEIWANLMFYLHQNHIPTLLINARLSAKSFKKYQKYPKITQQTLSKFSLIAAQNHNSAQRFIKLGAKKNNVIVSGNIKFDQDFCANATTLKIPINPKKPVVVFASTHRGEEAEILKAYAKIKTKLDALLLIVPRHPQRFDEVFALIKSKKLCACKRSDAQLKTDCEVMLGDSMGEMMAYFEIADVVFMGGSLTNTGGHNMLEPAALAKPILFGENTFNFAEISRDLIAKNAAIQVQDADELFAEISELLNHPQKAKTLGKNAKQYLKSQQGAVNKLIKQIKNLL